MLIDKIRKLFSFGTKAVTVVGKEAVREAKKVKSFAVQETKKEARKAASAAMCIASKADKSLHARVSKSKKKGRK